MGRDDNHVLYSGITHDRDMCIVTRTHTDTDSGIGCGRCTGYQMLGSMNISAIVLFGNAPVMGARGMMDTNGALMTRSKTC